MTTFPTPHRLRSARGLSSIETAIVLFVLVLVSGAMAPFGFELVGEARDLRVMRDCTTISQALVTLLNDAGRTRLLTHGQSGALVELLVSDAPAPLAASGHERAWTAGLTPSGTVDTLNHYLIDNTPAADPARAWNPPVRHGGLGWRGSYLASPVGADPWGRRYAVNVKHLASRADEVLVLSAGPNGIVETPFDGQHLRAGGDDIIVLVR